MAGSKGSAWGTRYAQITGWGMALPEKVVTNADLAQIVDTSDEWIVSRTGIKERRLAGDKETTFSLAVRAAREALLVAGITPSQLDLIIVATATPEYIFPATASLVQDALGATRAGAYDLSAGCSGFIYALGQAANAVRAGSAEHVLVIGSETLSRITDWTDRSTCVLFGDGAGAVVVSTRPEKCGVLASVLGSDGSGGEMLIVPAGGSHSPATYETVSGGGHFIKMNGREVFRFASTIMPRATELVVQKAGWQLSDVKLFIPHQANVRIIDAAIKRLGVPADRFFVNIERYGNTSAASIPIALCEALAAGRIQAGDKIVLVGFGAGLSWAAAAVEWGVPVPAKPRPWLIQRLADLWLMLAGVRSAVRRLERRVYDRTMGPEGANGLRGQLRKHTDQLRAEVGRRIGSAEREKAPPAAGQCETKQDQPSRQGPDEPSVK